MKDAAQKILEKKSPQEKFEQGLELLKETYLKRLSPQVIELQRLQELLKRGMLPQTSLQELSRMTHNSAGSGATFGFPDISKTARILHNSLKEFRTVNLRSKKASAERQTILKNLRAYEDACRKALENKDHINRLEIIESLAKIQPDQLQSSEKAITIFTAKLEAVLDIAEQLRNFGYSIEIEIDHKNLEKKILSDDGPQNILVYSDFSKQDAELFKSISDANNAEKKSILIIISPQDDYNSRLAAVRAGAQGFFKSGTDVLKIIDRLEHLFLARSAPPSYNVLIVDDDKMLAEFYSHALTSAGMNVTTLNHPQDCLKEISKQNFDLVMIDYAMPLCNGQELATIIRQHENYLTLPIIFISAREDIESLLMDSGLGIDDFMIKPFTPEQLVSVVRSRAKRAADLRALTIRDSFTGLLNHAHFLEILDQEHARAKRTAQNSALAIIDIDHFKKVNDTYGHAAGDQVIKGLARLLQQHLRRSDIIGRCGGEEFGIIMPNCTGEEALRIIEAIRVKFSETIFRIDGQNITASFSGGICPINAKDTTDTNSTIRIADKALYRAKTNGRNRVEF